LFEMDMKRQPYTAGLDWLVVSPTNARAALAKFIKGAKKELYIYDPNISDPEMIRALEERRKNGVEVRVLGRLTRHSDQIETAKLHNMRLHTRLILRDGSHAFIGSQSLRRVELDRRREVGMIFDDEPIIASILNTFLADWKSAQEGKLEKDQSPSNRVAKKVAKAVVKDMPSVTPMLDAVIQEMGGEAVEIGLNREELEDTVRDAVKHAVKQVIKEAVVSEPPPAQE
jgi:cardiolipin synthase